MSLKRRLTSKASQKRLQVRLLHYTKDSVDLYSTFDGEPSGSILAGLHSDITAGDMSAHFVPE